MAAVILAAGLLGGLVWILVSPSVGAALFVLCVLGALAWVMVQPRMMVARAGARPLQEGEHPRLVNVVTGVAADLGTKKPSIRVMDDSEPNAFASYAGAPVIGISTGFLEVLTRTELEAVVAHTLLRTAPAIVRSYAAQAALGPVAGSLRRPVGADDDLRTCAVTRYPPALASAIEKAAVAPSRRTTFWFMGGDDSHAPPDERIAALQDL